MYRLGGDEFIIVLPKVTKVSASLIAGIRQAVESEVVFEACNLVVSPSIGVAFSPLNSQDKTELLSMVDKAMYLSKKQDIDYCEYSSDPN